MRELIVATRPSALARAQTALVLTALRARCPGCRFTERLFVSEGDRRQDANLSQLSGTGFFTREIQQALLDGEADLAVHSLKDLPTREPEGLRLAATPERGPRADVLLGAAGLAELPAGAVIGTGSPRRTVLLRRLRPDVEIRPCRGNVDTRLRKLAEGQYTALVLAQAGLERLGYGDRIGAVLDGPEWYYAPGQGALAIEVRTHDAEAATAAATLHDEATWREVSAERAFIAGLGAGCQTPAGVRCGQDGPTLRLAGLVADAGGARIFAGELSGPANAAEALGRQLAELLLADGAGEVLS